MSEDTLIIYKAAIFDRYPNAKNLCQPLVRGSQQNVIFANVDGQQMVFKFGNPDIIRKNAYISRLYAENGIPCPVITAHQYKNVFFEEYKHIPGKTLYEHIGCGMDAEKIKQVYRETLVAFAKMGQIKPGVLDGFPHKHMHIVADEHITNVNNAVLGKLCMALVYLINLGNDDDKAVYHTDITPKNIVVSEDGHLVGILDIDTAAVSDVNYAFGAMAAKYIQLGFDINELFDVYEKISGKKLNKTRASVIANANNAVKKMLWQHSKIKKTR